MSFKSKFMSVFASAVVLGSAAAVASAQDQTPAVKEKTEKAGKLDRKGFGRHGGFDKGMRRGGGFAGLRGIELTDAQKEQIRQIHESNRPDQSAVEEMRSIMQATRGGTATDAQKARAAELRQQMQAKRESVHQQVLGVLTAEQRQQIEARKAEMQKRMDERRQKRQQRRSGTAPGDKSNDN
jgi:Spy/CpxP family protein refolding chaperone